MDLAVGVERICPAENNEAKPHKRPASPKWPLPRTTRRPIPCATA
jgi:hypothetical protein